MTDGWPLRFEVSLVHHAAAPVSHPTRRTARLRRNARRGKLLDAAVHERPRRRVRRARATAFRATHRVPRHRVPH
ncbi:MAG TPA: hypothetical protein VGR11_12270, partial [Solirubrobacteraceae bacterium]|nr:hypothetical protein [Solirubrobacteraceae bacterium]